MKTKLFASLVLAFSLVTALAGTLTISDLGQPNNQTTQSGVVAEYTRVHLTMRDAEFSQSVFLIVERRGQTFVSNVTAELYLPGKDKDENPTLGDPIPLMGNQVMIGPIYVDTNGVDVSIWAKVSHIETYSLGEPPILGLDITGIAVGGYTTVGGSVNFEGVFPLIGSTHWIWTNSVPPVARIEKFRLENRGLGNEFVLFGTIKPNTRYAVEASTNLVSWENVGYTGTGPWPDLLYRTGILDPKYNDRSFFRIKESP